MDDASTRPAQGLILVVDAGTQSIRAGLFNLAGQVVDFIKLPIQPYFSDQPGFSEQHCGCFWEKFCEASRELLGRRARWIALSSRCYRIHLR